MARVARGPAHPRRGTGRSPDQCGRRGPDVRPGPGKLYDVTQDVVTAGSPAPSLSGPTPADRFVPPLRAPVSTDHSPTAVLDALGEGLFVSDVLMMNALDSRRLSGGYLEQAQELMADAGPGEKPVGRGETVALG
jgi:hypothetical protein